MKSFTRCTAEGCVGFPNATGLCRKHRGTVTKCIISGCDKFGTQKKMCTTHYSRAQTYGITAAVLEDLLCRKSCDACGRETEKLHIDHDHSCCPSRQQGCGKCVRGMLCQPCNQALGFLEDDPHRILNLLKYLGA